MIEQPTGERKPRHLIVEDIRPPTRASIPPPLPTKPPSKDRQEEKHLPKPLPSKTEPPRAPEVLDTPPVTSKEEDITLPIYRELRGVKTHNAAASEKTAIIEPDIAIRTWEPANAKRLRLIRRIVLWGGVFTLLGIFAIPTIAFPKLSITLYPSVELAEVPATAFLGDTSRVAPDTASRAVPALAITVDRELASEYDTTGKKFVRERAQGSIRVFNAFSSSPQTLVAGTRFQDPGGRVFRLRDGITVPGARVDDGKIVPTSIVATAIADAVGESSNIGPTEFRIPGFRGSPKYDGFYAKSESPMSGGFEGEAKIVLTEDIRRGSEDVTRRVVEETQAELEGKVPGGADFVVLGGAREVAILDVKTPKPGDRADRFAVTARARGRLLIVRRSHITAVLGELLLAKDKRDALRVTDSQDALNLGGITALADESQFRFMASGELKYYRSPDIQSLGEILRTSTPRKAEAYLRSRDEIASFRLRRFPVWLWFIPKRAGGLELTIEPPK